MRCPSEPRRGAALALVLAGAVLALGACGRDGEQEPAPLAPPSSTAAEGFPRAGGKSLGELLAGRPEGPVVAPSVSVLEVGRNRFGFALFDRARKPITGATVALYTASQKGGDVSGPFLAHSESLAVRPPFRSRTSAADPDGARSVYVAQVPFTGRGRRLVAALVRLDGRLVAGTPITVEVGLGGPPGVGERAVRVHTPTVADAHGDLSRIDTRVPPAPGLHREDLADVLGRRPVVLVFATPQLCQSRVCGPVVDVAEQVRARYGERAAFIHMEIYRNNRLDDGFRPQVGAWRLPTEPWAFAIDRSGRVAARLEGAFSVRELERAVRRAIAG